MSNTYPEMDAANGGDKIRVLIVDDSAVMRGLWSKALSDLDDISVEATASNGAVAIEMIKRHAINVIVLDLEMPVMDGLAAIPALLRLQPNIKIIMASSFTRTGSQETIKALTLGAVDFVTKPSSASPTIGIKQIAGDLIEKIRKLAKNQSPQVPFTAAPKTKPVNITAPKLIAIGASTGGPNALSQLLSNLTPEVEAPILIVQHMPPVFTALLAERLAKECGRHCREPIDGEIILPQRIYIAPGDFNMSIIKSSGVNRISLDNTSPPENFCRPSVDVLFRSAAPLYGPDLLAIVLTGMGEDGRRGAEEVANQGGVILAQDEETSVVWGMPGAVVARGIANHILPLEEISKFLITLFEKQRVRLT